jgi:universal stress protein E
MAKPKTILAIIDPTSKAQPALRRAEWLAKAQGLAIELFVCEYDQALAGDRLFDTSALKKARATLMTRHRARLERIAEPMRAAGLRVSVDAAWDRPLHKAILRKIERSRPWIVFKDTHYHPVIRRSIFSNTDWNLIRGSSAPLWLVKPHEDGAIRSLLAAVDPLHERDKPARLDHKILKTAKALAGAAGARVRIVHAFDPAPVYAMSADLMSLPIAEPVTEHVDALRKQHAAALKKLASRHKIAATDTHLIEGEARDVLVGACKDFQADLMVIGAVARGAMQRLMLGSTAERVLDFLPCDLLIVKPDPAGK